eukprot:GHVS01021778.1.p1 GENE.GHVS01021778.1~~GHVS01021778.1.p1  ORF type:complete len:235 (+),score=21.78 GHVS01021778.1:444-1148(+)
MDPSSSSETSESTTPATEPSVSVEISVSVQNRIAPNADIGEWNILELDVMGVHRLPVELTSVGTSSPDDCEGHPFTYTVRFLGMALPEGHLLPPLEKQKEDEEREKQCPAEGADNVETTLPRVGWQGGQTRHYAGRQLVQQLKNSLDTSGGAWVYFYPQPNLSMLENTQTQKPSGGKKPGPHSNGSRSTANFFGSVYAQLRMIPVSYRPWDRQASRKMEPGTPLEIFAAVPGLT